MVLPARTNSLGISKATKDTRVIVAMSGGVDSSVVACLLKQEGYDVIGITLQLYTHNTSSIKRNSCCAGVDINDAKNVARKIGIPHYVFNYEDRFKQDVIDSFADSYTRGFTPIPCVTCNQTVKFKDMLKASERMGADCMATGHYIQRLQGQKNAELHRGADIGKDQSYFLFATTQKQVDFLRFPLGRLRKVETRALAKRYGLSVSDKPDSQDICFVPNGGYANLIKKLRPDSVRPGNIVHVDGTVLARHDGIVNYTVGQRRGLGIGGRPQDASPLYVIKILPDSSTVVVGPKRALVKHHIFLSHVNWIDDEPLADTPRSLLVKIRSSMTPKKARIVRRNGKVQVSFCDPELGVSKGQACVFYNQTRLLGGGWIT